MEPCKFLRQEITLWSSPSRMESEFYWMELRSHPDGNNKANKMSLSMSSWTLQLNINSELRHSSSTPFPSFTQREIQFFFFHFTFTSLSFLLYFSLLFSQTDWNHKNHLFRWTSQDLDIGRTIIPTSALIHTPQCDCDVTSTGFNGDTCALSRFSIFSIFHFVSFWFWFC